MAINTAVVVQKKWSFTFDQASVAANTGADSTAQTAPGAVVGAMYLVQRPATLAAGLVLSARCTTKDQILITFHNVTAVALDPASLTYEVVML